MFISILGMAGADNINDYSTYTISQELKQILKDGKYSNATDALLKCNYDKDFILIGTDQSIKRQQELLSFEKYQNITIKKYKKTDIKDVFSIVYEIIQDTDDEIYFDITHSFRDTAIMSVLSTIIHEFVNEKKITIIFAKEAKNGYEYIDVSDYINISQMAFLLTTFHHTLNVPILRTKIPLYHLMQEFSKQLFSNQISLINKDTYPKLKREFKEAKKYSLKNLHQLIDEVLNELSVFENLNDLEPHEMFFKLSKLMCSKNYLLISSTYLVEALTHYAFIKFKNKNLTDEEFNYDSSSAVVNFINTGNNHKLLKIPSKYFYCSNYQIFSKFYKLVKQVKDIRNSIAHIDLNYNEAKIKFKLTRRLLEYKKLIMEQDILSHITLEEKSKQEDCLKDMKLFEKKIKKLFENIYQNQTFNPKKTVEFIVENDIDKQPLSKELKTKLKNYREKSLVFLQEVNDTFKAKKIADLKIVEQIENQNKIILKLL
jgi:hypothetical protein